MRTHKFAVLDYVKRRAGGLLQGLKSHVSRGDSHVHEFPDVARILLDCQGVRRSAALGRPVAADGAPLPWYTYPAIEYFNRWDVRGLSIYEFGSGNSSLYWAGKGAVVRSVEHDPEWFSEMQKRSSSLAGLSLCSNKEDYAASIAEGDRFYDLVIIDGVWRNECAAAAMSRLKPDGVVLLDNADWYADVRGYLVDKGFFPIDFSGFGPINAYCWTTTLLAPWKSAWTERIAPPRPIGGIQVVKGEQW